STTSRGGPGSPARPTTTRTPSTTGSCTRTRPAAEPALILLSGASGRLAVSAGAPGRPPTHRRQRTQMTHAPTSSRRGPLLAVAAIVVLATAGAGLWYLFLRPAGPAPVSLGSAAPTEMAIASLDPTPGPATEAPTDGTDGEPAASQDA